MTKMINNRNHQAYLYFYLEVFLSCWVNITLNCIKCSMRIRTWRGTLYFTTAFFAIKYIFAGKLNLLLLEGCWNSHGRKRKLYYIHLPCQWYCYACLWSSPWDMWPWGPDRRRPENFVHFQKELSMMTKSITHFFCITSHYFTVLFWEFLDHC